MLVYISFVQFPSLSAYDKALRNIAKKGKLYRLEGVILLHSIESIFISVLQTKKVFVC